MKPTPLKALAKLLGKNHLSSILVSGVAIDSRLVREGDLFFALPGQRVDGHDYLEDVSKRGAVGAVVREEYRGPDFGLQLLRVPDVLEALQELARKVLEKRGTQVVAITGSLGKTTTKEFTTALLRTKYRVASSPKSYNTQATVPLSILQVDGDEEILILEMGMSQPGQIEKLISIAPPDVACLTTVAVQHATHFPDGLSGISKEKGSIFCHPKTRVGILNRDVHGFEAILKCGTCEKRTFSLENPEADFTLKVEHGGVSIGEHWIPVPHTFRPFTHNFLASVAIARALDVSWEQIIEAARHLKLPQMRFEQVEKGGILFINDAYNANPDSMVAALESLPEPAEGGKRIAVLGDMDALGMYSEGGHAMVAECALSHADYLLCLGSRCETMKKIWKREKKPATVYASREELEKALKRLAKPGDVVLLKGARAHSLDEILKGF